MIVSIEGLICAFQDGPMGAGQIVIGRERGRARRQMTRLTPWENLGEMSQIAQIANARSSDH